MPVSLSALLGSNMVNNKPGKPHPTESEKQYPQNDTDLQDGCILMLGYLLEKLSRPQKTDGTQYNTYNQPDQNTQTSVRFPACL
jgi:hypothetical protein